MTLTKFLQGWRGYGTAMFAGAMTPFAFEPVGFYPLAMLMPAVLFRLWVSATTSKQAFMQGLIFGISMFGVGASWVFISIHEYGNTDVPLATLFTLLFILILAFFTGLQGYLQRRFFNITTVTILLVFPGLYVLMEWIRSWIFSGFPWLIMGFSQVDSPLAGFIPVLGEFGTSFIVVWCSALMVLAIQHKVRWFYALAVILVIGSVGFGLTRINWTQPKNNKWYRVALVQGNIPQELKWSEDYLDNTLKTYLNLTRLNWDKDIIVWPESAIPTAYQYAIDFLQAVDAEAKDTSTALIVGIPVQHHTRSFETYFYNSLLVLGEGSGTYHKRHLVPFGEYLPLKSMLHGLIAFFNIPMSDFIPGNMEQDNLKVMDLLVAPYICYEIAYAEVVRHNLPQAEMMVTTSNDSWFGNSMAPWQHLEIGKFRALQTGRYMLFASNSGVTAIINPQGKVTAIIPQFKAAVLSGNAQAYVGSTPWVKIGTAPIIILLMLILAMVKINELRAKGVK